LKQELLFLKKKKQKDFFTQGLGRWQRHAHGPESQQFFGSRVPMMGGAAGHLNRTARRYFKKELLRLAPALLGLI